MLAFLQEGLGIVQVTLVEPEERVFLACISPTPLPYEHVKKGMNHRRYLEMDPRFAAELGIIHDTEVRWFRSTQIACLFDQCRLL